jgi:hypothetical protein
VPSTGAPQIAALRLPPGEGQGNSPDGDGRSPCDLWAEGPQRSHSRLLIYPTEPIDMVWRVVSESRPTMGPIIAMSNPPDREYETISGPGDLHAAGVRLCGSYAVWVFARSECFRRRLVANLLPHSDLLIAQPCVIDRSDLEAT